jgi:tryptophanyl-tRNA synthetase
VKASISILDDPDVVRKRIKSAVTDSDPIVRYDVDEKPGISNLLEIMSACTNRSIDDLVAEYGDGGYGAFKEAVAEALVEELAPIKSAYNELSNDDVRQVIHDSGEKGRDLAAPLMAEVRKAVGLKGF